MQGLTEQRVRDAAGYADACARHRWRIPADYSIPFDCVDRHPPERTALIYEDDGGRSERYSFGRIAELSRRFANALRGLQIARGDVVAIHLPQRPEAAIAHLACHRLGAIALPISRLFGGDALLYRLRDSGAKAIVLETDALGKLDGRRDTAPDLAHVITADGAGPDALDFQPLLSRGADDFTPDRPARAEDPALLMYTSGTTGHPKGVLHAARFVLGHNGVDYAYNFLREGDVYYRPADWTWVAGLLNGLLAIWPHGLPVVAYRPSGRFDPDRTLALMARHGASVGLLPPTALKALREVPQPRLRHPALRLRCIASGGEPVSPAIAQWTRAELGAEFNVAYGQTEANFTIGSCGALEAPLLEALGKPYPGHVVEIIDEAGQPVAEGEAGEIAVRRDDPVVMREYWRNAGAMREKFIGPWCRTGDIGRRDAQGWIHFDGRGDDIIKTSGYRVGPAEVEASVMEVPGVAGCAVIGVPDRERGEAIKAFVMLLPGHVAGDELARRIQAHVKSRLAAHEYPREVEFVQDFPTTVTGKVRRRELREAELRRLTAANPIEGTHT